MKAAVLRRYWPLAPVAAAVLALVTMLPSVEPLARRSPREVAAGHRAVDGSSTAWSSAEGTAGAEATGQVPSVATATSVARRAAGVVSGRITPPAAAGSAGVTRSGVTCGPGVRQVPWSSYAPPCIPAYRGDNGGATSYGVSGDTIVLSYRRTNSYEDAAINAAAQGVAPPTDDQIVADIRTYLEIFNRSYELYGRHVVVKDFQGQGDWLAENQGQGQPQAVADAARAKDVGAFADLTAFGIKNSEFYWSALARQHTVAFGPIGFPDSYYERNAPWWWTAFASGSAFARFWSNAVCRRMADLPAVYAEDAVTRGASRRFGVLTPDNPYWVQIGDELESGLARCGVHVAKRAAYVFNIPSYQSQATTIAAQMRQAGVTTVICYCDPVMPIFMSQAADQQQWHPEWVEPDWLDPPARLTAQDQWAHALSTSPQWPRATDSEAYRVFKLAAPHAEPADIGYVWVYRQLVQVFSALQAAGPELNPTTLHAGTAALPPSVRGPFGTWAYGRHPTSPVVEAPITWWSPTATSGYDGKRGAWQWCDAGAWHDDADAASFGPAHTQLGCFGR
jgi:hypothetical protein